MGYLKKKSSVLTANQNKLAKSDHALFRTFTFGQKTYFTAQRSIAQLHTSFQIASHIYFHFLSSEKMSYFIAFSI